MRQENREKMGGGTRMCLYVIVSWRWRLHSFMYHSVVTIQNPKFLSAGTIVMSGFSCRERKAFWMLRYC